jgi:hypothetical protein
MLWLTHCTENPIDEFPEMKPQGLVPNSYIHVSVSDLNIRRIGLPICLQHRRILGINKSLTDTWMYNCIYGAFMKKKFTLTLFQLTMFVRINYQQTKECTVYVRSFYVLQKRVVIY